MSDTLNEAIILIRAGRKEEARPLLRALLQAEPDNARGWLWLSRTLKNPQKKQRCLQKALDFDPHNRHAQQGLAAVQKQLKPQTGGLWIGLGVGSAVVALLLLVWLGRMLWLPQLEPATVALSGAGAPALSGETGAGGGAAVDLEGILGDIPLENVRVVGTGNFPELEAEALALIDPSGELTIEYASDGVADSATESDLATDPVFLQGVQAYERGDFDAAESAFLQIMHAYPQSSELHLYYAMVLYKRGEFVMAAPLAKYGAQLDPTNPRGPTTKAFIFMAQGQMGWAKNELSSAQNMDPDFPYVYQGWGVYYAALQDHKTALEMFDQAIELLATDQQFHINRALAAFEVGRYDVCVQATRDVLAINDQQVEMYFTRGTCHLFAEEYQAAIDYLDIYIAYHSQDACAWQNRGWAYRLLGDEEQAAINLARAEELRC